MSQKADLRFCSCLTLQDKLLKEWSKKNHTLLLQSQWCESSLSAPAATQDVNMFLVLILALIVFLWFVQFNLVKPLWGGGGGGGYSTETLVRKVQLSSMLVFPIFFLSVVERVNIIQSTLALRTPCYYGTQVIRTAVKSPVKINYRRLTEINSRYYGLSLLRTLTLGPEGVRH